MNDLKWSCDASVVFVTSAGPWSKNLRRFFVQFTVRVNHIEVWCLIHFYATQVSNDSREHYQFGWRTVYFNRQFQSDLTSIKAIDTRAHWKGEHSPIQWEIVWEGVKRGTISRCSTMTGRDNKEAAASAALRSLQHLHEIGRFLSHFKMLCWKRHIKLYFFKTTYLPHMHVSQLFCISSKETPAWNRKVFLSHFKMLCWKKHILLFFLKTIYLPHMHVSQLFCI